MKKITVFELTSIDYPEDGPEHLVAVPDVLEGYDRVTVQTLAMEAFADIGLDVIPTEPLEWEVDLYGDSFRLGYYTVPIV